MWGLSKYRVTGLIKNIKSLRREIVLTDTALLSINVSNRGNVATLLEGRKGGVRRRPVRNNGYGQTFRPEFHLRYCILSSWAKKDPDARGKIRDYNGGKFAYPSYPWYPALSSNQYKLCENPDQ